MEAKIEAANLQAAIDELIKSYVEAFGEQPDNVTGMVIRSSANRVLTGESYRWVQDGQWRKLEWSWAGFGDNDDQ